MIDGEISDIGIAENENECVVDGDTNDAEEGREKGDRPITILRNTLKWGHLCPTAPGNFFLSNIVFIIIPIELFMKITVFCVLYILLPVN